MEAPNGTYEQRYNYSSFDMEYSATIEFYHQILDVINTYFIPVLVCVGLCGNTLSLVVFLGTYLRKESLSVYLSALAAADSGSLVLIFIAWLQIWNLTIFHQDGICQVTVYLQFVCTFLSMWFMVSFIAERYIAVCYPLKRRHMCTAYRAKVVTSCIAAFSLIGYSFVFGVSGVQRVDGITYCSYHPEYAGITTGLFFMDIIVAFVIPFLSLVTMNGRILHKIIIFYKDRKECRANQLHLRIHSRSSSLANVSQLNASKLMLVISTIFVVISLPNYVIKMRLIVIGFIDSEFQGRPEDYLWKSIFEIVFYINFSINFFLYSICLKKFRVALKLLMKHNKHKLSNAFVKCRNCRFRIVNQEQAEDIQFIGGSLSPETSSFKSRS